MFRSLFIGATLVAASLGTAQAALYSGSYDLTDATAGYRGIWLNGGVVYNGTSDSTFEVLNAQFDVTGNTARLHGSTFSEKYAGGLDFDVSFTHLCTSEVSAANGNNVTVDNAACNLGSQPTGGTVSGADADGNDWDFWNWAFSVAPYELTGTGVLSGLTMDISQSPTIRSKPFRFGIAADWDNENLLGGSGWFNVHSSTYAPCIPNGSILTAVPCPVFSAASSGDFNMTAVVAVPEPPMIALLGLGLIAAGFATRRRKQS